MRMQTTLIIIVVTFIITAANFGSNLFLARQGVVDEEEQEIATTLNIAEELVSTKISLLSSNAETAAERLAKANSTAEMEIIMREQLRQFTDFNAFTVFNREGIVAECGEIPPNAEWILENNYVQNTLAGETAVLASKFYNETNKLILQIMTPMGKDNVLAATVTLSAFAKMFAGFDLWETGNIFMIDGEGFTIANDKTELVIGRFNAVRVALWHRAAGTH